MVLCELDRGEIEAGGYESEDCILKSERKILVFAIPHLFMAENFQFSELICVCIQLANCFRYIRSSLFVCLRKEKFYRNILLRFRFLCFQSCCCKMFHIRAKLYVYILNPIFWRTWKPHSKVGGGGKENFYSYTHSLPFFLHHPSIRERKTCVDI